LKYQLVVTIKRKGKHSGKSVELMGEKDIFCWVGECLKLEMNRDTALGSWNTIFSEVRAELCLM